MASQGTATVTLRDFRGFTARVTGQFVAADAAAVVTAADAFINAVVAMSNANEVARTGVDSGPVTPLAYGTNAQYANVSQKARLVFVDAAGASHALSVPAPKVAIFLADQVTVDSTNAQIVIIKGLAAAGTLRFGKDALSGIYLSGFHSDRRRKRPINQWTLNPSGTGPA